MKIRTVLAVLSLSMSSAVIVPGPARAGCGCDKAPPAPADVRPRATSPGGEVSIFHRSLVSGRTYRVTFASPNGTKVTVSAPATARSDLADRILKPQLVVALPNLPLGPASVEVKGTNGVTVLRTSDAALTVVAAPIAVPDAIGDYLVRGYRAAVGRDGTVYIALDLARMAMPKVIRAQALRYPLRFEGEDVVFWNTQGFLMQALGESMPGLYRMSAAQNSTDSDVLQYSRHEFNTYYLQHTERQGHALDAADPRWHLDGTPHIDHDHLILAIAGVFPNGALPPAGATPAFDLAITTSSLFPGGLAADNFVELNGDAVVEGDVMSNGLVKVGNRAYVDGDLTASSAELTSTRGVSGQVRLGRRDLDVMPFAVPSGLVDLGNVELQSGSVLTLSPGSYRASLLRLQNGGMLVVDNAEGPVTIYVTGSVEVSSKAKVVVTAPDPERLALYVVGGAPVRLQNDGSFYGVVYAPDSWLEVTGNATFVGAFVAREARVTNRAAVVFDPALAEPVQ
jgi:hypothetical protein